MAPSLVLPAPAKLNLFLHVTGRRPDGYHTLQTLFQLVDWGDSIRLTVRGDGAIERPEGLAGISPENDLAVRAARLLQESAGCQLGVDIRVDKRVPVGAGLGGGSSDAATVLVGLNRLWGLHWPLEELARLGSALGADVPVFIRGRTAFAQGVGDQLQAVELPERWYVIAWPGIPVSTQDIFQAPELTRNTPTLTMADLLDGVTRNDLQPVAIRRCPAIADVLRWLSAFGAARMSGSGSSVFAAVADEASANAIGQACPWPAWPARGVDFSPLHRAVGEV